LQNLSFNHRSQLSDESPQSKGDRVPGRIRSEETLNGSGVRFARVNAMNLVPHEELRETFFDCIVKAQAIKPAGPYGCLDGPATPRAVRLGSPSL
jgi:hypothetical protein